MEATLGAFGKLEDRGDFVQYGAAGPTAQKFRAWVERGVARAAGTEGYASSFDRAPVQAFIYRPAPKSPEVLAGVMAPSRDLVGRRFPLVVHATLHTESLSGTPHLLPVLFGPFLEQAEAAVVRAIQQRSSSALVDGLGPLVLPDVSGSMDEAKRYMEWACKTPQREAWEWIYGSTQVERVSRTLGLLRSAIEPLQGSQMPSTPVGMRLPLGGGGSGACTLWLDVMRRLGAWAGSIPTVFWSVDYGNAAALIQLGITAPGTFSELWAPDPANEFVCDATDPPSTELGTDAEALRDDSRPVAELLNSL